MNILFYTNLYPDYLFGGIERTTMRLSLSFKEKGHIIYEFYTHQYLKEIDDDRVYEKTLYLKEQDVMHKIDEIC